MPGTARSFSRSARRAPRPHAPRARPRTPRRGSRGRPAAAAPSRGRSPRTGGAARAATASARWSASNESRPRRRRERERPLDVRPGGVLDQDRPDADLERRLARPPPGMAVASPQAPVDAQQETAPVRSARLVAWPGDDSPRRARGRKGGRESGRARVFVDTPLRVPDNARGRKSGYCFIFGASAEVKMSLEDDLKARTSALISQQMANWVVEIQRAIQGHQASLVRALDELGETVARYDEKIDEQSIGAAIAEVVAQQPPPAPTADYSGLKASIAAIEKGANLSEVLTYLVNEVASTSSAPRCSSSRARGHRLVRARLRPPTRSSRSTSRSPPTRSSASSTARATRPRGHVEPLAGHGAGARPPRRRPAGRAGRAPHPARQAGRRSSTATPRRTRCPRPPPTSSRSSSPFAGKIIDVLSAAPRPPCPAPP